MARDPYIQREDERAREDEEDERRRRRERLDHHAPIGYDPADGGTLLAAPIREYACDEHPEPVAAIIPKAVKDENGHVVGYHYPIADGPYCVRCGHLMVLVRGRPERVTSL
jgi:hypothetical protein